MKKLISLLCLSLFAFSKPAENFEGVIKMETMIYNDQLDPTGAKTVESTYYIKGDKILVETSIKDMPYISKVYMDLENEVVYQLSDLQGQKFGMKMTMNPNEDKTADNDVDFKMTNETKEILGYNCKKMTMEGDEYTGEMWVTEDIKLDYQRIVKGLSAQAQKANQKGMSTPSMDGAKISGFPMESKFNEKNSTNFITSKVKQIEKKTISESTFDISGYQIINK